MKISEMILEEYQKQIKAVNGEGDFIEALAEGLKSFTQAYKDALYMEGEIERADKPKSCEHIPEGVSRDIDVKYKCAKCGEDIFKIDLKGKWLNVGRP